VPIIPVRRLGGINGIVARTRYHCGYRVGIGVCVAFATGETLLTSLRELWSHVEGTVMMNPHARIVETVESKEL
jgi:hypothetical protein